MPASPPAIALFVKTPGLSPLKTRLAATIGRTAAETFHRLSVAAIEAVVRSFAASASAVPYWSVAEDEGLAHPLWSRFERIAQGPGELGQRLSRVYDALQPRHAIVLFIGADSPQISPEILHAAIGLLAAAPDQARFVLGRSHDGGFYLFGGNAPVPRSAWLSVPYSVAHTADHMAEQLQRLGPVQELPRLSDADVFADLQPLAGELAATGSLLPAQSVLLAWLREIIAEQAH